MWEAQGAYQERAKKTEQKGDTKPALVRERSGGTLRSSGRITYRSREMVDVYILYYIILYTPRTWGLVITVSVVREREHTVFAWEGLVEEHGGEH